MNTPNLLLLLSHINTNNSLIHLIIHICCMIAHNIHITSLYTGDEYTDYLNRHKNLQLLLSMRNCIENPKKSFVKGLYYTLGNVQWLRIAIVNIVSDIMLLLLLL